MDPAFRPRPGHDQLDRKIAAAAPGEEWIHSLYGVGYKLETP